MNTNPNQPLHRERLLDLRAEVPAARPGRLDLPGGKSQPGKTPSAPLGSTTRKTHKRR